MNDNTVSTPRRRVSKRSIIPSGFAVFIVESVALGLVAGFLLWMFLPPRMAELSSQIVSFHDAVKIAAPAVVNIFTSRLNLGEPRPSSLGSGVIIDPKGYLLTNDHVVKDANEIAVALQDGRSALAKVVGRDPESDLAVLYIELKNLPSIRWGDPARVSVGNVVLAIGNTLGVGQTVSMGIVSGTERNQLDLSTFENFIQTDAAINPGNSGGALINTAGQLIGINTAILSRTGGAEGVGFAIPGDIAQDVFKQITNKGRVSRGWLGMFIQDLTPDLAESFQIPDRGVIVAGVIVPGPASDAGLKVSDIILTIDGVIANDSKSALNKIASYQPGNKVELVVLRGNKKLTMHATVSERPQFN